MKTKKKETFKRKVMPTAYAAVHIFPGQIK